MASGLLGLLVWGLISAATGPLAGATPAAAPAPATPGTFTFMQSGYTVRVTPSINSTNSTGAVFTWSFGSAGSVTTAGATGFTESSSGLEISFPTTPPAPFNTTLAPNKSVPYQGAFGGAACMAYSFATNNTNSSSMNSTFLAISDANAIIDSGYNSSGVLADYPICTPANCSSTRTIPLNASAGHYAFFFTNLNSNYTQASVNYQLYPTGSPACQNLDNSRVPQPSRQSGASSKIPALQTPGVILSHNISAARDFALLGSIRNTSCTNVSLNINSSYSSGLLPSPVRLLLIDEYGLESAFNPATNNTAYPAFSDSYCAAGVTNTSCSFSTNRLNPSFLYHLLSFYSGNSSAPASRNDALALVTFTTSGGACPSASGAAPAMAASSSSASSPATSSLSPRLAPAPTPAPASSSARAASSPSTSSIVSG